MIFLLERGEKSGRRRFQSHCAGPAGMEKQAGSTISLRSRTQARRASGFTLKSSIVRISGAAPRPPCRTADPLHALRAIVLCSCKPVSVSCHSRTATRSCSTVKARIAAWRVNKSIDTGDLPFNLGGPSRQPAEDQQAVVDSLQCEMLLKLVSSIGVAQRMGAGSQGRRPFETFVTHNSAVG